MPCIQTCAQTVNGSCWASRINSIIDHMGYTNIRINFDVNRNYWYTLKRRSRDQYIQEWTVNVNSMPKLDYYCKFKTEFGFES